MKDGFIIMQIGDTAMDSVCDTAIVPAMEECGLVPKRVDRDNTGDLLKAEIVTFIEDAQIIVADLTNERPNCYLEVGYAMGLGKKRNLILTVREDHHHSSAKFRPGGSKVHFDLEGYDLLLWDPDDLETFRTDLVTRIKRRMAVIEPAPPDEPAKVPIQRVPSLDREWVGEQSIRAKAGLEKVSIPGYMEAAAAILPIGAWRQSELLVTVEQSQVKTFGWPIGLVMNRDEWRPHPTPEGVRAEVAISDENSQAGRASYDYWYFRQSGEFFTLQSLFEDSREPNVLFFDTRIVRVTELLLFLARCYSRLDVPDDTLVHIEVTHGGLQGRTLKAANPMRFMTEGRTTDETSVTSSIDCTVGELQTSLVDLVEQLIGPLFVLFDFFEIDRPNLEGIVNAYVEGRVI